MMVEYFCDKCGKRIYDYKNFGNELNILQNSNITFDGIYDKEYCLCNDCLKKLKDWLEGE